MSYEHLIGRVCITPYEETAGLMVVQEITEGIGEPNASGYFLGDHPAGYAHGSPACYHASGVRPTWLKLSTFRDNMFAGELSSVPPEKGTSK